VMRMGVLVKSSTKSTGGVPPRDKYPDGPEMSRRMAREKSGAVRFWVYMVLKSGLYSS
jgi:hypothetical protein